VRVLKIFGWLVLGFGISIAAQYLGSWTTFWLKIPDPTIEYLYSSIGIIISLATAIFFVMKDKWSLATGLLIGIPGWWAFFFLMMAITGNWL